MKKLLFLLVAGVAGTFSIAHAQIQKGNTFWGGDLMDMHFGLNKGAGYSINIQPKAAYFIKDNLAVGGYVGLGISHAKVPETGDGVTTTTYNVGALGRYYVSPGEHGIDNLLKHGRFFVEANFGFGGTTISGGGNSANGINLGFGPGYAYFITPNVSLEGLVKYNGNFGFGNGGTTSAIDFGLGFQVYLPSSRIKNAIKDPSQL